MKLGFHYHIPILKIDNSLYLPGYLAVFVNTIANEVEELTLFLHEESTNSCSHADTIVVGKNISFVNLGTKKPAWYRSIFPSQTMRIIENNSHKLELILVRGPSPLAPYFSKHKNLKNKTAFLIVGDYREAAFHIKIKNVRDWLIKAYLKWNDNSLSKSLKNKLVLVNSRNLLRKYQAITKKSFEIRTTTLSNTDFWYRHDTCQQTTIRLAYIGRFDLQKGLVELIEAAAQLIKQGFSIQLHLTGWEDSSSKIVETKLKELANNLQIDDKCFFHGRKKVGVELNLMYREADIYIIPSYHEGFPRTIWEAMANSCPVIATTVGSIPEFLENEKHALLISPKRVDEIVNAVKRVISDSKLRQDMIFNGRQLASENTLEIQSKKLVSIIEQQLRK